MGSSDDCFCCWDGYPCTVHVQESSSITSLNACFYLVHCSLRRGYIKPRDACCCSATSFERLTDWEANLLLIGTKGIFTQYTEKKEGNKELKRECLMLCLSERDRKRMKIELGMARSPGQKPW